MDKNFTQENCDSAIAEIATVEKKIDRIYSLFQCLYNAEAQTIVNDLTTNTSKIHNLPKISDEFDLSKIAQYSQDANEFTTVKVLKLEKRCYLREYGIDVENIFIRDCYEPIYQRILNNPPSCDFILKGSPGIGHTYFGYYVIRRLMESKISFLYEPYETNGGYAWLYKPNSDGVGFTVVKTLIQNLSDKIDCLGKNAFHIIDDHKPQFSPFRRVLITSPCYKNYHDMQAKDTINMCFMSVWTLTEIESCYQSLYSNLDRELVYEMFRKYGGVPRYVFRDLSYKLSITGTLFFKRMRSSFLSILKSYLIFVTSR